MLHSNQSQNTSRVIGICVLLIGLLVGLVLLFQVADHLTLVLVIFLLMGLISFLDYSCHGISKWLSMARGIACNL